MTLPARLGLETEDIYGFIAETINAAAVAARELGIEAREVSNAADEAQVDALLAIGSVNLYPDLVGRPKSARRVLWHVEPLPKPVRGVGDLIHRSVPTGKLLDLSGAALPPLRRTTAWQRSREEAANVREPATNLAWLRRHAGAIDRLVIDTFARAEGARDAGIPHTVVPFGYHRAYAGPIGAVGPRDIDVLMMGNVDPLARRHRVLSAVQSQLATWSINLVRVPGHTYGNDRRQLLERARVSLDVHRIRGGYPLYNFILSSAAGAALVTEPLIWPEPLVPGVHYVEADASQLAQVTRDLLGDEPRRRRIVEAAQALLTTDLDLHRTLPLALG